MIYTTRSACRWLLAALLWGVPATWLPAADAVSRQVTFKLTFAQRDLIWLGDPASPATMVYLRKGARPVARDVCLITRTESQESPGRRYYREARLAPVIKQVGTKTVTFSDIREVRAFTTQREIVIGTIDGEGRFSANENYTQQRALLPSWPADPAVLKFDAEEKSLYEEVEIAGPVMRESLDFLPWALVTVEGKPVGGRFSIDYAAGETPAVTLHLDGHGNRVALATASVPTHWRRGDIDLGSYDNTTGTYLGEAAYRSPAGQQDAASVTVEVRGELSDALDATGDKVVFKGGAANAAPWAAAAPIAIDGHFDDWRNVAGVDDPRGDVVPYLEYVPDVDLLEFKVAHDEEHIYLYARVAGKVGRTHPQGGRAYFYAYMDVDQNPGTGFLPTRDDDCYFGVDIGDDCEVQFEFVDNVFRKTFYGFCGLGGDGNVLKQQVTLGKSQYGRLDERGREREDYKAEYIYRGGVTEITEDLKLGTSDTIRLAVSPDGSEVEVVSSLAGFLKDPQGKPTLRPGQTIDVAAGMESDSKVYPGKTRWGADSTAAIRGYQLRPAGK